MSKFLIYFFGYPLTVFWIVRTVKSVFFWLYLWQLKEYHIGRFVDHFRTAKGKKSLINSVIAIKILLLFFFFSIQVYWIDKGFLLWVLPGLLIIYMAEAFKAGRDFLQNTAKKPVFTKKITFIFSIIAILIAVFVYSAPMGKLEPALPLLIFDLLTPVIVSAIVLIFQPFFVIARNRVLKKAKRKIGGFKNLTTIGITGSYGKTSTKEFLTTILSGKFNVLATPEHKNSEIGVAQTILEELNENHEIFIVEMGAYRKGGIKLLCDIVRPKVGIVTGVNEQHLAMFGSMDNLLLAEGGRELSNCLPKNGFIALNGDNKHCLNLYKEILLKNGKENSGAVIYTTQKNKIEADIWIEDLLVEKEKISFIVRSKEKEMMGFSTAVSGGHNAQNLLGAILVARKLGMSFDEISKACGKIIPGQGGMTMKKGAFGINVIDSSYSSNPDGVIADLDYLKIFEGKKAVVMPCLIELGAKSADVHRQIGAKIADVCDIAIIATKDKFKEIKTGAIQNGMAKDRIIFCENPKEIFNLITTFYKENDSVLLEGRVPGELIKLLNVE